jgi:hypothetical protein
VAVAQPVAQDQTAVLAAAAAAFQAAAQKDLAHRAKVAMAVPV